VAVAVNDTDHADERRIELVVHAIWKRRQEPSSKIPSAPCV
jgi:hypothetical protein